MIGQRASLEDAYEKKEDKFLRLVECYAPGKTDEELKDLILKVHEASMSHPFPEEWLKVCLQEYQVDKAHANLSVPVDYCFVERNRRTYRRQSRLSKKPESVCLEADGPLPYLEALDSDLAMVNVLKKLTEEEWITANCGRMLQRRWFLRHCPEKKHRMWNRKKRLGKEYFRDEEKGILKNMMEKYFCWDEDELLDMVNLCRTPLESLVELVLDFQERFARKKREKNILDFTDMEHFALHILAEKEGESELIPSQAARELSEKYEEVMIDEYQDSNSVQEIIKQIWFRDGSKTERIFLW